VAAYSWEDLGARSLARQFPQVARHDADAVAAAVGLIGPIQAQTARSPFVGLGARMPGVSRAAITEAYESLAVVRGSNIRGTVHTSTASAHSLLDAATRVGNRSLWNRMLRLDHTELEDVWRAIEAFAGDAWRTPAELSAFLTGWLVEHGEPASAARLDSEAGRYFAFGHGGLLRRPLHGGWEAQGAPGYRTASALLPDRAVPTDPLLEIVRLHLASYGPSSRYDVSWWSGLGLRQVDELLGRLPVTWYDGPDGRSYAELPGSPAARDLPGVRLLPEFDAIFCGYDPKARDRFAAPADNEVLWQRKNGYMLATMLVDGRVGGYWRLEGTPRSRELALTSFPGARRPRKAELEEPAAALATSLDVSLSKVTLSRL
jgi:Winged helix DNA-binding domain